MESIYNISKKAIETNNLDKLFFTNNIMESCNAKLNDSIIKDKNNTINNFNNKINYIINLYKLSGCYKHPIFSKTKALATYFITNDFFENIHIINRLDLKKIFIEYQKKNNLNNNISDLLELSDIISEGKPEDEEENIQNLENNELVNKNVDLDIEIKKKNNNTNVINIENKLDRKPLKRKSDNLSKNIINNDFRDENKNKISDKEDKINDYEIFEINMKEYCNYISYINYKLKCYDLTINNISEINKDKYDHNKIFKDKDILEKIKNFLIINQQDGITFKKTIKNIKTKFEIANINNIFNYDSDENWDALESKILNEVDLDKYRIFKKKGYSKKILYPKNYH